MGFQKSKKKPLTWLLKCLLSSTNSKHRCPVHTEDSDSELTRLWEKSSDLKHKFHRVLACSPAQTHTHATICLKVIIQSLHKASSYCCCLIRTALSSHYFWRSKYIQTSSSPARLHYFWPSTYSINKSADSDKFTHHVCSEKIPVPTCLWQSVALSGTLPVFKARLRLRFFTLWQRLRRSDI